MYYSYPNSNDLGINNEGKMDLPNLYFMENNDVNSTIDQGTKITVNSSNQWCPDIYGDIIVYEDDRDEDGNWFNGDNTDIYGYNLVTNEEFPICINPKAQKQPKIYKDKVVWTDWRNDPDDDTGVEYLNGDIYLYNLTTKEEIQITTDDANQEHPDIYEDIIVWDDYRDDNNVANNWEIYMYDLETRDELKITDSNAKMDVRPVIYQNIIVWENWLPHGYSNICYYNIYNGENDYLTQDLDMQLRPDIYQNNVVWVERSNGEEFIILYNIASKNKVKLNEDGSWKDNPRIYNDLIVWEDYRNSEDNNENSDIYMYNLTTDKEIQLSFNDSPQVRPSIYNGRVVCDDGRDGNANIYLYEVGYSPPEINHKPMILSFIADPNTIKPNERSSITVNAIDYDGDELNYEYQCSAGTITGNGPKVTWIAPETEGAYIITVIVKDDKISSLPEIIEINVEADDDQIPDNEIPKIDENTIDESEETTFGEPYVFFIIGFMIILIVIVIVIYYVFIK